MAKTDKSPEKVDVVKDPRESGQSVIADSQASVEQSGDTAAIVNPALDTESVTIPYAFDEDGQMLADHFEVGKTHMVAAGLLEIKNTEGVNLLVKK